MKNVKSNSPKSVSINETKKADYLRAKKETPKLDVSFLADYSTSDYESRKKLEKAISAFIDLNPNFRLLDFSALEIARNVDFHSLNSIAKFQGRAFKGFQYLKRIEKIGVIFGLISEKNLLQIREEKETILESRAYLQKEALDKFRALNAKIKAKISSEIEKEKSKSAKSKK